MKAPGCTSTCQQGRKPCPVPQACRLVDEGKWEPLTQSETLVFWARVCTFAFFATVAVVLSFNV